jgi:membrane protein DedA with SNARE-associated domain/rhodanese-related sulfurtransferase
MVVIMANDLARLIHDHGLLLVFLNVLADQMGAPTPAAPTLVVAGAVARNGGLSTPALVIWSLVACFIADNTWYLAGRRYGNGLLRKLCRLSLEPDSCVSETQTRFERWGLKFLVLAKFVPGFNLIAAPLAGTLRIKWWHFIALSTLGAALWIGAALSIGMIFSNQIEELLNQLRGVSSVALLVVVGLLVLYVSVRWWQRRRFYVSLRMARISVDTLRELIDKGAAPLIVDVRTATSRSIEPRCIPGAVVITLSEIGTRVRDLPREGEIVLYCTCPSEASAARVARLLQRAGFPRVRPLLGGLEAWIEAGYSVTTLDDTSKVVA